MPISFLKCIYFNWRMISLQVCDVLCHTSVWIGHQHTCDFSLLKPLPPPSLSHLSRLLQNTGFRFPASYIKLPLAIYFTYGNVNVSMLFSQIIPPSFSPMCLKICFMSAPALLPFIKNSEHYISRFYIYALIYDICLLFLTYLILCNTL